VNVGSAAVAFGGRENISFSHAPLMYYFPKNIAGNYYPPFISELKVTRNKFIIDGRMH
jgi:hypothetical protein